MSRISIWKLGIIVDIPQINNNFKKCYMLGASDREHWYFLRKKLYKISLQGENRTPIFCFQFLKFCHTVFTRKIL